MTEVLVAVLAFLGAAVGSGLAFVAARAATRLDATQGRREEWGRRFGLSLEALVSPDDHVAAVGRALLRALLESSLASADDRRVAVAVLEAEATPLTDGGGTRDAQQVDSIRVVQENGSDEGDESR